MPNMQQWISETINAKHKKAMPILSFPGSALIGVTVGEMILNADLMARAMAAVAARCDTLAAVGMMDLSVEAQAFGSTIKADPHEVPTVIGSVVNTPEDAENLRVPEVGEGRTGIYVEAIRKAGALITDRPILAGVIGPFSLAGRLIDLTNVIYACYDEPEMVHTVLRKVSEFLKKYINAFKAAGAKGLVIAEPAAGLLSPELVAEFSNPYVNDIIKSVQTPDFIVIYHNCGNVPPLLDEIKKLDASVFHFGNTIDLAAALPRMPADRLVMGNIDPATQFRNGTPESIYAATTALLGKCAGYANYVPSSGCDIPPPSPWANIDAFHAAVADFYKKI